mmetsp:Transcript_4843/g.7163  ORF Transcript_4843/g.7163 Transcript_4843/m.7163 type:complete len:132 (-) Transcript_4843:38-433(-)
MLLELSFLMVCVGLVAAWCIWGYRKGKAQEQRRGEEWEAEWKDEWSRLLKYGRHPRDQADCRRKWEDTRRTIEDKRRREEMQRRAREDEQHQVDMERRAVEDKRRMEEDKQQGGKGAARAARAMGKKSRME